MTKIYINKENKWVPVEDVTSIANFLGDPARTGEVYLCNPDKPAPELDELLVGSGGQHFATNYGLVRFFSKGTTHILPPNCKGYVIAQLTDIIVDLEKNPEVPGVEANLGANFQKMSTQGRKYRVDSTFDAVMGELREHYRFVGPEEGESPLEFLDRIRGDIEEQRRARITDEFVEHVNKLYFGTFHWAKPTTKEEMLKHFKRFYLGV